MEEEPKYVWLVEVKKHDLDFGYGYGDYGTCYDVIAFDSEEKAIEILGERRIMSPHTNMKKIKINDPTDIFVVGDTI